MRIMHLALSCFYIDNYNYQENVIPRLNKRDNHEVMILASTETYINNNEIGYTHPKKYINEDGIPVVRLRYKKYLPLKIVSKIRIYENTLKYIEDFKPDVIMFHGTAAAEILKVKKYKKTNPNVKFYVDSHEDFNNSAKSYVSKYFLHSLFYKPILKRTLKYIDKIFYISLESYEFMHNFYKVPSEKLEFLPLGGKIIDKEEYAMKRKKAREELNIKDEELLILHSGKMNKDKKTLELLKAFTRINSIKLKLILIGSIGDEIREEVLSLISSDQRINFLGWKNKEEMYEFLCATDLYAQPGSQSATLQNAICARCPVMVFPYKSHEPYITGNGFKVENIEEISEVFVKVNENPEILNEMKENSQKIGKELLDYNKLSRRVTF